ncbi:uncharacterized protein LOC113330857 [Papaver somniferum]|uniref:uncharacterized protein LOC113330857 n=1 Tax=Papaver somniferum TaxID=3469 RepID=UPI000E701E5E|nr:uncharacterized protein LOC113330857 [Papaver somniferum]XP_026433448.1 uncharacterized protein LOC113330857 [Papaver somniferum]XP_026433451.1 uncharacterized protein LOC113330857 [Papaver somniferum]XP_026433457.1 uncharacterized protein LOC113330857 [Papaver somniferum]
MVNWMLIIPCTIDSTTSENRNLRFTCYETDNNVKDTCEYDGFIVVFDRTKLSSYKYAKNICHQLAARLVGYKPVVLVANKINRFQESRKAYEIAADQEFGHPSCFISAMNNTNVEKPFLSLARLLTNVPRLIFLHDMPIAGKVPGGNIEDPPIPVDIPIAPSLSTVLMLGSSAYDQVPAQPSQQIQTTLKVLGDTPDAPLPSTVRHLDRTPEVSSRQSRKSTLRINGVDCASVSEILEDQRSKCCYC